MGRDGALDNPINWSFRLGRLFAIDIRVHIAFILCAVVLVWMELPQPGSAGPSWGRVLVYVFGTYAMLFFIVLLHEFGHSFGARYTGGEADEILLWPLGGLAFTNPPHNARAHLLTTAAGPTVNVILCLFCSVVLVVWTGRLGAVPWNPLCPMLPVDQSVVPTTAQWWLIRFFGLSYLILLLNLLPIFPFDGGRILQAWLWPKRGYQASMELATGTGMVGAIIIGLSGIFFEESWLLLLIAGFGYFTCWQTRHIVRDQGAYGLLESEGGLFSGYTFGEAKRPGFFERRRQRRAARKAQREQARRQEHEAAVERILRKVSRSGVGSLTPGERRILECETKRKRESETETHDAPSL